jgi:phosphoribosyl 1,2-cyclic phosphodiesterase
VLLLESGVTSVLVDAGLSYRKLVQRFEAIGRELPEDLSAVLVTHGHGDHAAHASTYATRFRCPLRATEPTVRSMQLRPSVHVDVFAAGRSFRIGDISIRSRKIPHDAPQIALRFETKVSAVGLVTDLGHVPKGLAHFLSDCETLLLESNHDSEMLAMGPYPAPLKRRVGGSLGHLSNAQAGDLLAGLRYTPKEVVLMHLSETNNSPHLARSSAEAALGHRGITLRIAKQRQPIELGVVRGRQLQLGL